MNSLLTAQINRTISTTKGLTVAQNELIEQVNSTYETFRKKIQELEKIFKSFESLSSEIIPDNAPIKESLTLEDQLKFLINNLKWLRNERKRTYADLKELKYQTIAINKKRKELTGTINLATGKFLHSDNWEKNVLNVLEAMGKAIDATHAYIFENFIDKDGDLWSKQIFSWNDKNPKSKSSGKAFHKFSYKDDHLQRWEKSLSNNENIKGLIKSFPPSEQKILKSQHIFSLMVAPIFAGSEWWGFIRFDDCQSDREWSDLEIEVLETVTNIIGMAIQSGNVKNKIQLTNKELIEKNEKLKQINRFMIGRELKMIELKQFINKK